MIHGASRFSLEFLYPLLKRFECFSDLFFREPWRDVLRTVPIERLDPNHVSPFDGVFAARFAKAFDPLRIRLEDLSVTQNFQSRLAWVVDHN